jgi:hypothetical protein
MPGNAIGEGRKPVVRMQRIALGLVAVTCVMVACTKEHAWAQSRDLGGRTEIGQPYGAPPADAVTSSRTRGTEQRRDNAPPPARLDPKAPILKTDPFSGEPSPAPSRTVVQPTPRATARPEAVREPGRQEATRGRPHGVLGPGEPGTARGGSVESRPLPPLPGTEEPRPARVDPGPVVGRHTSAAGDAPAGIIRGRPPGFLGDTIEADERLPGAPYAPPSVNTPRRR